MITVKDFIERLQEFPEGAVVLVSMMQHMSYGYQEPDLPADLKKGVDDVCVIRVNAHKPWLPADAVSEGWRPQ